MFDIPLTASFQEHERGVRRPYRLHCSSNLEMGERERLGVWLSKHQPFAAFGTRAQIDKYAQRMIRRQQEGDS